jgi:hypothetical protein
MMFSQVADLCGHGNYFCDLIAVCATRKIFYTFFSDNAIFRDILRFWMKREAEMAKSAPESAKNIEKRRCFVYNTVYMLMSMKRFPVKAGN